MPLTVGTIEVEIFARYNGQETPLGTVSIPLKVNATSVIREASARLGNDDDPTADTEALQAADTTVSTLPNN